MANFETTIVFFGMRVCRSRFFLRFWGLNLAVSGSRIRHLVWDVLQKPTFHICGDYVDFGVIFTCFSLVIFAALETGMKIQCFARSSWGS